MAPEDLALGGGYRIEQLHDNAIFGLAAAVDSFYGDGGPAADAALCEPTGVTLTPQGSLLIADLCSGR